MSLDTASTTEDNGAPISETRAVRLVSNSKSDQGLKADYDKSWAVVIGINGYHHMPKLHNAVKDADGMARLLIGELGFPREQVLVVLDPPPATGNLPYDLFAPQASKPVIERLLFTEIPNQAGPNDRVIIFFAGHGERRPLPSGKELGYLAPVEAQSGRWEMYIPTESITGAGDLCQAKHVFYLFDACYSGLAHGRADAGRRSFEQTMLTHRARMALTAGTAEQVVYDPGPEGHSPFTWYVLQGLRGEAARPGSTAITGSDLMLYVRDEVSRYYPQQNPDFSKLPGHESGADFVFRVPSIAAEITRGQAYAALERGELAQFRKLADRAAAEDATSLQARYLKYRALLLDNRIAEAIRVTDSLSHELWNAAGRAMPALPFSPWELEDICRKLRYWETFLTIAPGAFPLQVTPLTGSDEGDLKPVQASRHSETDADVVQSDQLLGFQFTNPTQDTVYVYYIGINVDGHLMTEHLLGGDALYHGLAAGATVRSRPLHGFGDITFFEVRLFSSPVQIEELLFAPGPDSPPAPKNTPDIARMAMKRWYVR